jgi:(2R)-sulfolactate sulfo-lyase subunit alpha
MKKGILLHEASDDVGVAAMDIQTGEEVQAVTLEGAPVTTIKAIEDIPLGHKVAMRDMAENHHVQEYGRTIGFVFRVIKFGEHVHVHNIKSLRWAASRSKVLVEK